jgi:pectinesterase
MASHVRVEGWHNWGKESNEKTARFAEFNTTGPGANSEQRVPWSKQLTGEEAARITASAVLAGSDGWDPKTK